MFPLEVRLLRHVSPGEDITTDRLVNELGYKIGQCNQAFSWLSAKGCISEKSRTKYTIYELTETGLRQAETGLPVERIFSYLRENGPASLPVIASALSLEQSDVGSAFGSLSSSKTAAMNEEKKACLISDSLDGEVLLQRSLIDRARTAPLREDALTDAERKAISKLAKKS